MSPAPGISEKEWNFISTQLCRIFEPGCKVHLFGSRYRGDHRQYSDLDLAIDQGAPIKSDLLNALEESFAESDLTYKIDLIDFQLVDKDFQEHIKKNGTEISLLNR